MATTIMKTLDTHGDLVRAWLLAQGGMSQPLPAAPQPSPAPVAPASRSH